MRKLYYFFIALIANSLYSNSFINAQGVAVNVSGTPPDNSAMMDINAINKGFLIPRMTTLQRNAIANPAQGLQVYNTDCNVFNYNAGTPQSPNWATLTSSTSLIASVSIAANPSGAICSGTSVTFTATPAAGINAPNYQWMVNGSNVGTNATTYTTTALTNGDVVNCILTSNAPCVTGSPATSNSITMIVNPIPSTPGVISGDTAICANSTGHIFSVGSVSGATYYNWTVPGDATITSGASTVSITVTFGSTSGNVSVVAVNGCGTSSMVSQYINILPVPTANAGPDQSNVPGLSTVYLNANTPPSGTTGTWNVISGLNTSFSDANSPTSTFTGTASCVLSWTVSSTYCGTASDTVNISFTLPAGCAHASDNTVWCVASDNTTSGAQLCGYPAGYSGTYYQITNAGAAALGKTIAGYGDCATNYTESGNQAYIQGWSGSSCWTTHDEWARNGNNTSPGDYPVVRCTGYE